MQRESNWFFTLLGYAEGQKSKFILSVLLSVISVTAELAPYFFVYRIVEAFAAGTVTAAVIWQNCLLALLFYGIKALFYGLSTGLSHHVAFSVIAGLRLRVTDRFLHAPLGEVQKLSIGAIKNMWYRRGRAIWFCRW